MKSIKYAKNAYSVLLLLALVVSLSGCLEKNTGLVFKPIASRSILALSADDIVQVMSRAGFSDEQIVEYGPGLRSALANSGACQVIQGETIDAVFGIQGDCVYVSTQLRGSFIYNAKKNGLQSEFRSREPGTPGQQAPSVIPADGRDAAPLLQTTPTGNKAPKLQFFNG